MKKFSVFLIVIAVVIFTSCDKNKGDDFTYGDYPDSVNKNDEDDYNYVKKDVTHGDCHLIFATCIMSRERKRTNT